MATKRTRVSRTTQAFALSEAEWDELDKLFRGEPVELTQWSGGLPGWRPWWPPAELVWEEQGRIPYAEGGVTAQVTSLDEYCWREAWSVLQAAHRVWQNRLGESA